MYCKCIDEDIFTNMQKLHIKFIDNSYAYVTKQKIPQYLMIQAI